MKFEKIPANGYIKLDRQKLKEMGFALYSPFYFGIISIGDNCPSFKLKQKTNYWDEAFGPTRLTQIGNMKIPAQLNSYTMYCVTYDAEEVHITLA